MPGFLGGLRRKGRKGSIAIDQKAAPSDLRGSSSISCKAASSGLSPAGGFNIGGEAHPRTLCGDYERGALGDDGGGLSVLGLFGGRPRIGARGCSLAPNKNGGPPAPRGCLIALDGGASQLMRIRLTQAACLSAVISP